MIPPPVCQCQVDSAGEILEQRACDLVQQDLEHHTAVGMTSYRSAGSMVERLASLLENAGPNVGSRPGKEVLRRNAPWSFRNV